MDELLLEETLVHRQAPAREHHTREAGLLLKLGLGSTDDHLGVEAKEYDTLNFKVSPPTIIEVWALVLCSLLYKPGLNLYACWS